MKLGNHQLYWPVLIPTKQAIVLKDKSGKLNGKIQMPLFL